MSTVKKTKRVGNGAQIMSVSLHLVCSTYSGGFFVSNETKVVPRGLTSSLKNSALQKGGGFFVEKKVVIKIGSGVLLTKRQKFDEFRLKQLANQVCQLQKKGIGAVLVVSGAVAVGSNFIELTQTETHVRQAAAGLGQIHLMTTLMETFKKHELQIAQVLVTKEHLDLYKDNIKKLLEFYLDQNIVPVLNENDVLDLNSFGGNDLLAGEIAKLLKTEEVIILSTMKGSKHGVGGGATKIAVKKMLEEKNIATTIVNGKAKNILLSV